MANGIHTNKELIYSVINDLNEFMKAQASGQMIQAASIIAGAAQKLSNLYKTVDDDLKNREETIESLKEQLRRAGMEVVEVAPDKLEEVINE